MESYSKFDFNGNAKFQEYVNNLYPPPQNLEKYKRKWYKQNIDPTFDIDVKQENPTNNENQQTSEEQQKNDEQKQQQQKQQQQQQQQQYQQQQQQQQQSYQQQQRAHSQQVAQLALPFVIEGVLKVLYFPCLLFLISPELNKYVNMGSIFVCLMAIVRLQGYPKYGSLQDYFARIIQLEFTTNIFYIIVLFSNDNFVFQMPIALHFLVGGAELWTKLSQEDGFTLKAAKYIFTNKDQIMITKQKIEIYLFFYSLIGIFLRRTSFFMSVFILQNILLKTKCNRNMRNAQAYIRVWYADNLSENRKIPEGVRKVLGLLWKGYEKLINIF